MNRVLIFSFNTSIVYIQGLYINVRGNRFLLTILPFQPETLPFVYELEISFMITRQDNRIPGLEKITGETFDIKKYRDFALWNLVWYGT